MKALMKLFDEIVQNFFLPAVIGEIISEKERKLYSLAVRSGGLGISLFSERSCNELENSLKITAPVVAVIITQGTSLPNADKTNEATEIITQRKSKQLTNNSSNT